MSITADPSLDQALALVRRLSPRDQARLVAQVVAALADSPPAALPPSTDAWSGWTALRADIAEHFPHARLADRLDADRRERDMLLRGGEQ